MTSAHLEQLVREGVERIPEKFRVLLQDVALVIEDEPTAEQRATQNLPEDEELLGLYEGTPHTERAGLPYRFPDKVTIFRRPIERMCDSQAACIRAEVAHTVWHELAHVFGTAEDRLAELEAERDGSR